MASDSGQLGVYSARAWYAVIFNDDSTQFNDDTICAYTGSDRMMWLPNAAPATDTNTTNVVNKQIAVYPNPASDVIYIVTSLNAKETAIINLYNLEGVVVKQIAVSGGVTTNTLFTDNLANSIYMYWLTSSQQYTARGKVVIAR